MGGELKLPPRRDDQDRPRGYVAPGQKLSRMDVVTVLTIVGWVVAAYTVLEMLGWA